MSNNRKIDVEYKTTEKGEWYKIICLNYSLKDLSKKLLQIYKKNHKDEDF